MHKDTISAILKDDLDLLQSCIDKWEENPKKDSELLYYAVSMGRLEIVEYLLSRGADVNLGFGEDNILPLVAALQSLNYESIIRLLIAKGADVNGVSKSNERLSVLGSATLDDCTSLALHQLFLEHSTAAGKVDNRGNTPLHLLLQYRLAMFGPSCYLSPLDETTLNIIKLFLKNGVSLYEENKEKRTCFSILREYRRQYEKWSNDKLEAGKQSVKRIDEILTLAHELEKEGTQAKMGRRETN